MDAYNYFEKINSLVDNIQKTTDIDVLKRDIGSTFKKISDEYKMDIVNTLVPKLTNEEGLRNIYGTYLLRLDINTINLIFSLFAFNKFENIDILVNMDTDGNLLNLIGIYCKDKDTKMIEKYLLMGIDKSSAMAAYTLADIHLNNGNANEFEKYVTIAIKLGHSQGCYKKGKNFNSSNKYDEMVKYYLMAISIDENIDAIDRLCYFYNGSGEDTAFKKYCLIGLTKYKNRYSSLINYANNYLKATYECRNYDLGFALDVNDYLNEVNKTILKNNLAICLILTDELRKNNTVQKLISKKEECCVCKETAEQLSFSCGHGSCYKCFLKINQCPLCRKKKI